LSHAPQGASVHTELPSGAIDGVARTFARFLRIESAAGGVLLLSTIVALVIANSPWSDTYLQVWQTEVRLSIGPWEWGRSILGWINDGAMTLFLFLVALELKREFILGEIRNPRRAAFSLAAAIGGMIVPAVVFMVMQWDRPGEHGWGMVMATDTAFVLGALALLGARIPQHLRVLMLSMAVIDDIGAIVVVALGYGHEVNWYAILLATLGFAVVRGMAIIGVRAVPMYVVVGSAVWIAVDASGLHATVTGVILGLLTPARRWVSDTRLYAILDEVIAHPATDQEGSANTKDRGTLKRAEAAAREALSPVERLEMGLHPWVAFLIMPVFALANAGIVLSVAALSERLTLSVFCGLVVGKPIGVLVCMWLSERFGLSERPDGLGWGLLTGGAMLSGIGFTMSLFIANLALSEQLVNSAKMGILLASVVSAVSGILVLMWFTRERG
jgi:NhaA family Na+:H+ antiporter